MSRINTAPNSVVSNHLPLETQRALSRIEGRITALSGVVDQHSQQLSAPAKPSSGSSSMSPTSSLATVGGVYNQWVPSVSGSGGMTTVITSLDQAVYAKNAGECKIQLNALVSIGGSSNNTISFTLPFKATAINTALVCYINSPSGWSAAGACFAQFGVINIVQTGSSNFTSGQQYQINIAGSYRLQL
jgi:hypothetical protein